MVPVGAQGAFEIFRRQGLFRFGFQSQREDGLQLERVAEDHRRHHDADADGHGTRRPHPTRFYCNILQVLSKIAIAFGREDYPYAWKTDIDGSDVLFGWARVNGDLRYIHP